jgi:hypothetical protein
MPVTNQEHLLRDSKDRQDECIDDAYGTQPPQSYSFLLFKHRQHIAGGVFYLALFERLFALAFTAKATPSPEVGRSDAAGAGRDRDRQTHDHGG